MSEEPIRLVLKTPRHVADRFRRAARVRHMTQGDYLERLMILHDCLRELADTDWGSRNNDRTEMAACQWIIETLAGLQLQTVTA